MAQKRRGESTVTTQEMYGVEKRNTIVSWTSRPPQILKKRSGLKVYWDEAHCELAVSVFEEEGTESTLEELCVKFMERSKDLGCTLCNNGVQVGILSMHRMIVIG